MDYDKACADATTAQGLDPVVERLTAEGFPVAVEQTGGFCMVVTVTMGGRVYAVTADGGAYFLGVYTQEAWHDTGEDALSDQPDLSLDDVVAVMREAQAGVSA